MAGYTRLLRKRQAVVELWQPPPDKRIVSTKVYWRHRPSARPIPNPPPEVPGDWKEAGGRVTTYLPEQEQPLARDRDWLE